MAETRAEVAESPLLCQVTKIGKEDVEMPRGTQTLIKFEESCEGRRLVFKNEYWIDSTGDIVRSLQVTSPELGFLLLEKA